LTNTGPALDERRTPASNGSFRLRDMMNGTIVTPVGNVAAGVRGVQVAISGLR
jgi:hypothetical protein